MPIESIHSKSGRSDRWDLKLTDVADEVARSEIEKNLELFNDEFTGIPDDRPLDVLINSKESGQTVGGLVGRTSLGVFFINLVYLPNEIRRTGIGSTILAIAEAEAHSRGCKRVVLFTISFQAPKFYERYGYRVFGRIPCAPPGHERVFMTKELTGPEMNLS